MRVELPQNLSQKQLLEYLRDNERDIIRKKKTLPIHADSVSFGTAQDNKIAVKTAMPIEELEVSNGNIAVDVIANLSMWLDSHSDIMLPDSWKKSIKEQGNNIPFIRDHIWETASLIALTRDVFSEDIELSKLGIKSEIKQAQALIFRGELGADIYEPAFNQYRKGLIKQHSIGLQYVQIDLAINDPDDKQHYKVWEKYINGIINKGDAMARGFFFAVKEARIFENSAVLFASNVMARVLQTTEPKSLQNNEPSTDTQDDKQPIVESAVKQLKRIFNT